MYICYYVHSAGIESLIICGYQPTDEANWLICSESEFFVGSLEELLG